MCPDMFAIIFKYIHAEYWFSYLLISKTGRETCIRSIPNIQKILCCLVVQKNIKMLKIMKNYTEFHVELLELAVRERVLDIISLILPEVKVSAYCINYAAEKLDFELLNILCVKKTPYARYIIRRKTKKNTLQFLK